MWGKQLSQNGNLHLQRRHLVFWLVIDLVIILTAYSVAFAGQFLPHSVLDHPIGMFLALNIVPSNAPSASLISFILCDGTKREKL